jgi:malate dehydrogenase (oxaloacetate-decarboxylating)(NADP+)
MNISLHGMTLKDPTDCPNLEEMARKLFNERARKGYNLSKARRMVRRPIHHGVMMLRTGEADGMVCGADRTYVDTLRPVLTLAEMRQGVKRVVGMHVVLVEGQPFIFADTTITFDPNEEQLVETTLMAATVARHFNMEPVAALLSFSDFGDNPRPQSRKMRRAVEMLKERHPDLRVDGEMRADTAIVPGQCGLAVPDCMVLGRANVLIFPDLQSANIAYKLVGHLGRNETLGPLLYGLKQPINVVSVGSSVEKIVNMAALSAYEVGRN